MPKKRVFQFWLIEETGDSLEQPTLDVEIFLEFSESHRMLSDFFDVGEFRAL